MAYTLYEPIAPIKNKKIGKLYDPNEEVTNNNNKSYKIYEPTVQQDQSEGFLNSLLRNTVSAGANAISSVANLAKLPEQVAQKISNIGKQGIETTEKLTGHPSSGLIKDIKEQEYSPILSPIVDKVQESTKELFPKGYLEPKKNKSILGLKEETFQDYASLVPSFLLGGGNYKQIPSYLAKIAAGRFAGDKVKKSGGGETVRIITEIAVPALLSSLNPSRISKEFKDIQQKDYNEVLPELAKGKSVDAKLFHKALDIASDKANEVAGSSRHLKNLQKWSSQIVDGKLPLSELQPLKARINELTYDQNNRIYKPIAHALKKMGEESIHSHPEYGNALKRADLITKLYVDADNTRDFIKNATKSIPIKKASLIKKGIGLIFDNPGVHGAKVLLKMGKEFPKETLKYASQAFKSASEQNTGSFIKHAEQLGKLAQHVDSKKENKSKNLKSSGKYKLYEPI